MTLIPAYELGERVLEHVAMCLDRVYQLTVKEVRDLACRISNVIGDRAGPHTLRVSLFVQFPDHVEISESSSL